VTVTCQVTVTYPLKKEAHLTRLLLASSNRGKLAEMQALLNGLDVELVLLEQVGIQSIVEETGTTYAENATLKAQAAARGSGLLAIADDSGLEVDALGGLPGIHSARFAVRPGASDADRRAILLRRLVEVPPPWTAHFHCSVAIATPQGELYLTEGDCYGEVIAQERGTNGFGYDPIFWIPEQQRTMAELAEGEKNRISHRARAVAKARPILTKLISRGIRV
jgi:XTP/dITP diphosphohydrolase